MLFEKKLTLLCFLHNLFRCRVEILFDNNETMQLDAERHNNKNNNNNKKLE
jgi:hypothetical protein